MSDPDAKRKKKKGWGWPNLGKNKKAKKKSDQTRVFPHSDNEIDDLKVEQHTAALHQHQQQQQQQAALHSHTQPISMNGHHEHATQQNSGTSTDSHESGNLKASNLAQLASGGEQHNEHKKEEEFDAETQAVWQDIDNMVTEMTSILSTLKAMSHTSNTHHSMDLERFQKLIEWVDYKPTHLDILRQAWDDQLFWPFLSTTEAEQRVRNNDKETMLVRLSNTMSGAITVTRKAKRMRNNKLEDIVKHKRYFPAPQFGRLLLEGSWGERQVTWDGLLAYLQQEECCICLEELKEHEVLRLNCGHHFHRKCIEQHVRLSTQMNHTGFAVCPLCRNRIENAELIQEPTMAQYKKIPNFGKFKSKSAAVLPASDNSTAHKPHVERGHLQRAQSAEFTPTQNPNDEETVSLNFAIMADHEQRRAEQKAVMNGHGNQANHNWGQFGNHLDVAQNDDEYEDEYANLNDARAMAKGKK